MRTKELLRSLKKALQHDYLYNSEELDFMREQLNVLESELMAQKRKKPEGFGTKK